MIKKSNFSFQTIPFISIIIFLATLTIFPQKSLQDTPYVCPYPCLPPPIAGSTYPTPTPVVPRPSTPATSSNCPPPPSPPAGGGTYYYSPPPPPSSSGQYYYSPPPPSSGYYTPPSYGYYPPSYGYYPPSGGSMFPYGNAPPPPNPILPYFPYYFKNPPPSPQDMSSATRLMSMKMMNQFQLQGSLLLMVMLLLSLVVLLGWR